MLNRNHILFLAIFTSILVSCTSTEPISQSVQTPTPIADYIPSGTPSYTPTLTITSIPTPTNTLTPAPTYTTTPSPEPQEVITVMTYNILVGGGANPMDPYGPCEECFPYQGVRNRLPRIMEIIKTAAPDILGIQEAFQWQFANEAVARQVALDLGMNYYIGLSGDPWGNHVVLFTKFRIVEANNFPNHFMGSNPRAGLHAVLETEAGNTLHIFVFHIRPDSPVEDEAYFMAQVAEPYVNDLTIIMGDMNFRPRSVPAENLWDSGFVHVNGVAIDHVWVSPVLAPNSRWGPSLTALDPYSVSDHRPVVAEISLYPMNNLDK